MNVFSVVRELLSFDSLQLLRIMNHKLASKEVATGFLLLANAAWLVHKVDMRGWTRYKFARNMIGFCIDRCLAAAALQCPTAVWDKCVRARCRSLLHTLHCILYTVSVEDPFTKTRAKLVASLNPSAGPSCSTLALCKGPFVPPTEKVHWQADLAGSKPANALVQDVPAVHGQMYRTRVCTIKPV